MNDESSYTYESYILLNVFFTWNTCRNGTFYTPLQYVWIKTSGNSSLTLSRRRLTRLSKTQYRVVYHSTSIPLLITIQCGSCSDHVLTVSVVGRCWPFQQNTSKSLTMIHNLTPFSWQWCSKTFEMMNFKDLESFWQISKESQQV